MIEAVRNGIGAPTINTLGLSRFCDGTFVAEPAPMNKAISIFALLVVAAVEPLSGCDDVGSTGHQVGDRAYKLNPLIDLEYHRIYAIDGFTLEVPRYQECREGDRMISQTEETFSYYIDGERVCATYGYEHYFGCIDGEWVLWDTACLGSCEPSVAECEEPEDFPA